jgi:DNA-binding LacI/PurR family transcriptional regulator
MQAAGLKPLLIEGDFTERGGQRAAQQILELNPRPTAVFAANDVTAIGALGAFATAGVRVPEDIALMGYDGLALGALPLVNLTTITQPLIEMGRIAAEQVFAQISDPKASGSDHDATLALTVRGSTSRA